MTLVNVPGIDIGDAILRLQGLQAQMLKDLLVRDSIFYVFDDIQAGDADLSVAINRTIARANTAGGGVVQLPVGTYTKTTQTPPIQMQSKVWLRGAGPELTTLVYDDTDTGATNKHFRGGSLGLPKSNVLLSDFAVKGMLDTVASSRFHLFEVSYVDHLTVERVRSSYSRNFGMVFSFCSNVRIFDNLVERSWNDGISCWNSPGVFITRNTVRECGDDGISCHVDDTSTSPTRSMVIIELNQLTACNGIKALGVRHASISRNLMRRMHSYAVVVGTDVFFEQGNTPGIGVKIDDNIILDVLYHPLGLNGYHSYIMVGGVRRSAGSLDAAPGWNDISDGSVADLFGTNAGYFYNNDVDDSATLPSPGDYFFHINNNICARSLPAVAQYSDFGYGSLFLRTLINPAVTEANLKPLVGLHATEAIHNVRIDGNTIANTIVGMKLTSLDKTSPLANGFYHFDVTGNRFWQFETAGFDWDDTTPVSHQDVRIHDNDFDGDPLFKSTNRGANGTWLVNGDPTAINLTKMKGADVRRNRIRNVARTFVESAAGDNFIEDNTVFCQPILPTFSTSNRGVGAPGQTGGAVSIHIEDSNPASPTFRQKLFQPNKAQRKQLIRNNSGQGFVAGTPGSGPTNWFMNATVSGLTLTRVGTGVENGIDYIDVQLAGTASATSATLIMFDSITNLAVVPGDVLTISSFRKLVAGTTTGIVRIEDAFAEYDASSVFIANRVRSVANLPTTAALIRQRQSFTGIVLSASAAFAVPGILVSFSNGATIDITFRIGLPQAERGDVATSPIRSTSAQVVKAQSGSVMDDMIDLLAAL